MNLTYFDTSHISHLIEEFFELTFSLDDVPFASTIVPLEYTNLTYIKYGEQKSEYRNSITNLNGLMVSGQFFRSYQFFVATESKSIGLSFHPTALYKLLNVDISKLENKHIPLLHLDKRFNEIISPIFENGKSPKLILNQLSNHLKNRSLTIDNSTKTIDAAVEMIRSSEGLLNINTILEELCISQKTLELQFKKIVGITPGKYIRKYRFIKLMRKYESQEIELKDLIYMYDYYDQSHFSKDFKLIMNETPKSYFKKEYPLIKEYLKS